MTTSEGLWRFPKISEDVWNNSEPRICIAETQPCPFPSKIRDLGKITVNYSFYMDFSFLTLIWVYIFLGHVAVRL